MPIRFGKQAVVAAILASAVTLFITQSGIVTRPPATVEASAKEAPVAAPANDVVLAAPGRVEGQSEAIEVGAGADGVLTAVRVHEGQQVAVGEVLAARAGKCVIRAPQAGRVLRVHLLPGETVSTVTPRPVISLADLSRLRVRAEVDERDLGRLRIGQTVAVSAEAFPERQFGGRVVSFGARMGRKQVRTGDPAEKSDRDVPEVLIDLNERDERLVVGLRTSVRFLAQ